MTGEARFGAAREAVDAAIGRLREAGIELPVPWDARAYCDQLARWRQRPIHLVPGSRFGWWYDHLWISGRNADFIVWADRSSAVHQQHGILHEIGHLVLEHSGVEFDPGSTKLTHLKDTLRTRHGYDHPDELAAECFATTLGLRVATQPIPMATTLAPGDAEAVERLATALGVGAA